MDPNQPTNESAALGLLTLANKTNLGKTSAHASPGKDITTNTGVSNPLGTPTSAGGTVPPPFTSMKNPRFQDKDANVEIPGTITDPNDNDILSGRGNGVNHHPGNMYFRSIINKFKATYVLSEPSTKKQITRQVLNIILSRNPPARFLKQDAKNDLWYELGKEHALRKTAQALREKAPELKKKVGLVLIEDATTNNITNVINSAQTKSQAALPMQQIEGILQHGIEQKRIISVQTAPPQHPQESYVPPQHTDTTSLVTSPLRNHKGTPTPSLVKSGQVSFLSNINGNGDNKNTVGVANQAANVINSLRNNKGTPAPSLVQVSLPTNITGNGDNDGNKKIVGMANQVTISTNPNSQATHSCPARLDEIAPQNRLAQAQITAQFKELSGPTVAKITQRPMKDLPYTFNYKTVSILSAKMSDTGGDQKRKNTDDDENETLKNVATVASTNCDLTALYLITRMSANAFQGFAKIEIVPKESDVLVDGVIYPNHPGNIQLADSIQGYRTEYLGTISTEVKNDIEKQVYACIVTKNPSNSNPPGYFLQRAKDSKWRRLSPKEAIVVIRSLLDQACSYILNADTNDILFDGDLKSKNNPGTVFFNAVIQRCRPLFLQSPPEKKTHYVAEIVGFATTRPARFLGYVPQMGMWTPLSFDEATKKTREALRDHTRVMISRTRPRAQPQFQVQTQQSQILLPSQPQQQCQTQRQHQQQFHPQSQSKLFPLSQPPQLQRQPQQNFQAQELSHLLPQSQAQQPPSETMIFDNELTQATNHAAEIHSRSRSSPANLVNKTKSLDKFHSGSMGTG